MQNIEIDKLSEQFEKEYGAKPLIYRSAGRINIIGEHTDYNDGFVLPGAIDKAAFLAISPREDDEIHLTALDLDERYSVAAGKIEPVIHVSWPNYMLGPVAQFQKRGIKAKGFNAMLTSDIPIGAGLSSSAAVLCATTFALNEQYETKLEKIAMIKMARKAENEFAGVMCGIMDHFASMMGKANHVIKLDCRSLDYEYIPFDLDKIKILLLDTNVEHSLAASEYNTRREECIRAVSLVSEHIPNVTALRDVTVPMLEKYVLPKDEVIFRRGLFVVQEIDRLLRACDDLKKGDINALGKKMYQTHDGLSKMYEVSCRELDFLIDFVRNRTEVLGARMMGGGFGGCTINLVKEDAIPGLIKEAEAAYSEKMGKKLGAYVVSTSGGTCKIIN